MTPTIRQVAARAKVSPSTVSRVLNEAPHVNDQVRQAVQQAAQELEYPLDKLRRPAPTPRTVLLTGFLHGERQGEEARSIGREFTELVMAGVRPVFEAQGLTVRVQGYGSADDARSLTGNSAVGGVILLGGDVEHLEMARQLRAARVPVVIAGGHARAGGVDRVTADYAGGIEQAVQRLATSGRRRVALINGPDLTSTSEEKYRAFRGALALHDLEFDSARVAGGDFTSRNGYELTLGLLERAPDTDAILYADDYSAMGGLRALKESGRRLPDDVAIIGFHDYEIAAFTDPPLTTVHFDMRQLGAVAAKRVLAQHDDPNGEDWHVLLPTTLTVRSSA